MPKILKGNQESKTKFKLEKKLTEYQCEDLLKNLQIRFERNMNRHTGITWDEVLEKLNSHPEKLVALYAMEQTGGEPDIVGFDKNTGEYIFYDCSPQSPRGRRSLCYDQEALESRKVHKPVDSVQNMAKEMGIKLLSEQEYNQLQKLGEFDTTTSSWVETPAEIREHGGAAYCDRRYNHIFFYHNGAESYYAARGFRGSLRV